MWSFHVLVVVLLTLLEQIVGQSSLKAVVAPERRLAAVGNDVGFECGHLGSDSTRLPTVVWQKDSVALRSSANKVELTMDGILIVRNLQTRDSGVYSCGTQSGFAPGQAPTGWAHAVLTVVPDRYRLQIQPQTSVIPRGLYKVLRYENRQTVDLNCLATGHPLPYITWRRRSGKPLPAGRHSIVLGHLKISNFDVSQDVDEYICSANNTRGFSEESRFVVGFSVGWGEWGEWEVCTTSCGSGYQRRRRQCMLPGNVPSRFRQHVCSGNPYEDRRCNPGRCPPPPTTPPPTTRPVPTTQPVRATNPPVRFDPSMAVGNGLKWIGCFADLYPYRVMPYSMRVFHTSRMNPQMCVDHCQRYRYIHAGVQNGNECWCGGRYWLGGKQSNERCNIPCRGNPGIRCGGLNALSVYEVPHKAVQACEATLWRAYDRPLRGCNWESQIRTRGLRNPELPCTSLPRLLQTRFIKVKPCPQFRDAVRFYHRPTKCEVVRAPQPEYITHGVCKSVEKVWLNYCSTGNRPLCPGAHSCTYKKVSNRNVVFNCGNGVKQIRRIAIIEECHCRRGGH